MRFNKRMALPWLGSLMMLSACGGYGRGGVGVRVELGPRLDVYGYSAVRHGDWHANYQQWTPVVVYESNGQYYPSRVRGGREVEVYTYQSKYFLPPRDDEWSRKEKRFNSKRRPNDGDYGRARSEP
jgi:hypothetical protein